MLWGLPLVVVVVLVGNWLFFIGVLVFTAVAMREFWGIAQRWGIQEPLRWEIVPAAALVLIVSFLRGAAADLGLAAALTTLVVGSVVRAAAMDGPTGMRRVLDGSIWAILSIIYIPWLVSHLVLVRSGADGVIRTLGTIVLVWGADVLAYLVGSLLGRHRLAQTVSPGKSVEGAVAAVLFAAVAGGLVSHWIAMSWWAGAILGGTLAAAGLVGDLWESLLKRGAQVKDSGGAVPGHGGLLDRFDSLLLAAPVAFWLFSAWSWLQTGVLR